jgi:hypothetical protein
MQFERFYSLIESIVAWCAHFHQVRFQPFLTNMANCLGGIDVSVMLEVILSQEGQYQQFGC